MAFQVTRNITDAQEIALTQLLNLYAAKGIVPSPPPTAEEFLNARVDELIQTLKQDYLRERAIRMSKYFALASEQKIVDAENALGIV